MRGREARARSASLVAIGLSALFAGNVYRTSLTAGRSSIPQATPDGDYFGRLAPAGAGNRHIVVWVRDLDIWARRR